MQLKKFSLRTRIFVAMILIVVIASILIALITIYQYKEQSNDYHEGRLERKENAIMSRQNGYTLFLKTEFMIYQKLIS